jgi:uncharacterized coiled-coil protein SlyX
MIDGGGCSKPLCQASTLIELTFMEAMEKIMDSKFAKLEDRLNDIEEKSDKMFRIITTDEYGKGTNMAHGKMDQRLTTLEETLDSVSESVIDKLMPAVIKMQKDVKTIRKDIDNITKQSGDENLRLNQTIHKMQDRLDETFLRASDTKQMGREIIKNTQDLLREANKNICISKQILSSSPEVVMNMICLILFQYYSNVQILRLSNMKTNRILYMCCCTAHVPADII